jgi:hypothetical protein
LLLKKLEEVKGIYCLLEVGCGRTQLIISSIGLKELDRIFIPSIIL